MKAILICVGDELLTGQTVDTNSSMLAGLLTQRGVEVVAHWTIGDDQQAITEALQQAADQVDLVIVSGGLGPTADDLTRNALGQALGRRLLLNDKCLADLRNIFRRHGRKMASNNRIQAMIPEGCDVLSNPIGTACGIAARMGRTQILALPGMPQEARKMFLEHIAPKLHTDDSVILQKTVHTFGIGESDLAEKIDDLMHRQVNPSVGTTASRNMVSIRITARAANHNEAETQIQSVLAELHHRLGDAIVSQDDESLAEVVGKDLRDHSMTLAVAESCTGGLLAEMLTEVSGSSEYFLGGVVAYSNQVKRQLLDVPASLLAEHGAVSEPVAAAMAQGCRRRFSSDYALAITGIAGPTGGSEDKPVGLVYIALAVQKDCSVYRHVFTGSRDRVRHCAALAAMKYLQREGKAK